MSSKVRSVKVFAPLHLTEFSPFILIGGPEGLLLIREPYRQAFTTCYKEGYLATIDYFLSLLDIAKKKVLGQILTLKFATLTVMFHVSLRFSCSQLIQLSMAAVR